VSGRVFLSQCARSLAALGMTALEIRADRAVPFVPVTIRLCPFPNVDACQARDKQNHAGTLK